MVGVAARCKRIRRRVLDNSHTRLGQTRVGRNFGDDLVQPRFFLFGDFVCACHAQRDVARAPIGEEIHDDGNAEKQQHAALAAQEVADNDQQAGQRGQQNSCFQCVAHRRCVCYS